MWRYLWASPWTVVGLAMVLLARVTGGQVARRDGVLEAWDGVLRSLPRIRLAGGIGAITLGHVVLATHEREMRRSRAHERAHVRQYETWGPLFVPAYLVAALAARMGGGDAYFNNRFEVEARAAEAHARLQAG